MSERRLDPRRARTRKAVLDAAEQAFAARGERAGVDDIYDRAGVSMATIYAVFGSKDGIALSVGDRAIGDSAALEALGGSDAARESAAAMSEALMAIAEAQPVGLRALTRRAMAQAGAVPDGDSHDGSDGDTPEWDALIGGLPHALGRELDLGGDGDADAHVLLLYATWHSLAGLLAMRDSGEIPATLAERAFQLGRAGLAGSLASAGAERGSGT